MSMFKSCTYCCKKWDGRAGYYASEDGDTYCSRECAHIHYGPQFDADTDNDDEMNWYYTEAEEGDIDEEDVEILEGALADVYNFLEVFEGLEGVEEHIKRIEFLLYHKVE